MVGCSLPTVAGAVPFRGLLWVHRVSGFSCASQMTMHILSEPKRAVLYPSFCEMDTVQQTCERLNMLVLEDISISLVENYQQVETLLLDARIQMFSEQMNTLVTPSDLKNFDENYVMPTGAMWRACTRAGTSVATIGYRAYDDRFNNFSFAGSKPVEVGRLYVSPSYRRLGLATQLFSQLKAHAAANHVDTLYLHTHPFLPGALEFWKSHGFQVVATDEDPVWQTIHMVCSEL